MNRRKRLAAILIAGGICILAVWCFESSSRKKHGGSGQTERDESSLFGHRPCGHLIDVRTEPIEAMIEPYHGFDADFVTDLPQSFAGYSLAVGDVDNDGDNELVLGTTPDSRLYISKYDPKKKRFATELLEEELAGSGCSKRTLAVAGGVSGILVDDINGDGMNEIAAMTDQLLKNSNVRFCTFSRRKNRWHGKSGELRSDSGGYSTHGLAAHDMDSDGVKEVFSVHDGGALLRHQVSRDLSKIYSFLERTLTGQGKSLEITDLFGNGTKCLVFAEARKDVEVSVQIYGFSDRTLSREPTRLLPTRAKKRFRGVTTCTGDLDNDGRNELVVAWTRRARNEGHVVDVDLYRFDNAGSLIERRNLVEDTTLFGGAGELGRRMCIGRIGHAEDNRLYISSSRGDEHRVRSKFSERWGLYELALARPEVELKKIANFNGEYATAANICIGDVDNDGNDELIVGTGRGIFTRHGRRSYVFVIDK